MEDLFFNPQEGGDLTQYGGPRMPELRSISVNPPVINLQQPLPAPEPSPLSLGLQAGSIGMKAVDFMGNRNLAKREGLGLIGGQGYTMPIKFEGDEQSTLVNMYKTKPDAGYFKSKLTGPYANTVPGNYLLDKLPTDFAQGITPEQLNFMGEDFVSQLPDSVFAADGTSQADLIARHLKFRNPNATAFELSQPIQGLPGANAVDLKALAPNTQFRGPFASKFTPVPGQAQGPGMQIWKAFKGAKGTDAPSVIEQLFPKASGATVGTAAGNVGANSGLFAGMGPMGWSMLGLQLLQGTDLMKKNPKLAKLTSGISTVLPLLMMFSDRRLKENINKVGESFSGTNIYEFNYKGREGRYRGVISDEVPWAVTTHKSGYDMVDYNKVDVGFKQVS